MNSAYYCELAWRTISVLIKNPGDLRNRIPIAWDNGMSNISLSRLPDDCVTAKRALKKLRDALTSDTSSYMSKTQGAAYASLRGKHCYPTLHELAKLMLAVHSDLERHFESKLQGAGE